MHYLQDIEKRKAEILEDAKTRYPGKEVSLFAMFEQTWGSTALGFGGIGGAAMTTAYTSVVRVLDDGYAVYFKERFAYEVSNPTEQFFKDVENKGLASVRMSGLYHTNKV